MSAGDWFPIWLTLKVSLTATFFTVVMGLGISWLFSRVDFRGKNLADALIMQPLVIPPTVLGYYLLVVFGRNSFLGQALEEMGLTLIFTWRGAVVAATVASLPIFVKPVRAALESVDSHLENAARLLGKSEWTVFRTVTLPLAWRGILAGGVMAFARCMGEFGATLMVAGNIPGKTQTVSIAIYEAVQMGDDLHANTLVLMVTLFSVTVLWFVSWLTAGKF